MTDHPSTRSAASDAPAVSVEGPLAREALALAAFDHVVSRASGFRPRDGQRQMAAFIASTLSGVRLGDESISGDAALPDRGIAVVQAGTGVGKSAAYAATVIPLALAQGRRVVISTATVALQEQLIHKDLPALAGLLPQPFAFALAKGRGRYVCRLKLDQLGGGDPAHADLFGTEDGLSQATADTWQERGRQYQQWSQALDQGDWDGDRDRLDDPPEPGLWGPVAAERHTCTARHCPAYNSCSYYQARQRLAQALRHAVDLHAEFTLEGGRVDFLVSHLRDRVVAEAGKDVGNAPNRKSDHQNADNGESDDTGGGFAQTVEHGPSFSPAPFGKRAHSFFRYAVPAQQPPRTRAA